MRRRKPADTTVLPADVHEALRTGRYRQHVGGPRLGDLPVDQHTVLCQPHASKAHAGGAAAPAVKHPWVSELLQVKFRSPPAAAS